MDESLNGMAMVTGKSRDEIDQLIPRIQALAKDTSTAMTEIAGLITEYTKQGRTLEESFVLAEETAKAAKIAGISAAESIKYMTSAINGFNLAATDATRVSDVFANIAAISATDYEQLAIALIPNTFLIPSSHRIKISVLALEVFLVWPFGLFIP